MADSQFSPVLSFAYLSELAELYFAQDNLEQLIREVKRPYAFIRFEVEMARCLRRFSNIHLVSNEKLLAAQKLLDTVDNNIDLLDLGYHSISTAGSNDSLLSSLSSGSISDLITKNTIDYQYVDTSKFSSLMKYSVVSCWIYIAFWNVCHDIKFGFGLHEKFTPVLSPLNLSPSSFPSPLNPEKSLSFIVLAYGLSGLWLIHQVLRFFFIQSSSTKLSRLQNLLSPSPSFESKLLIFLHSLVTLYFLFKINNVYTETGYNYFAYLSEPRIYSDDYVTFEKEEYRIQMSIPIEDLQPPNTGIERLPYQVYIGVVWMWIAYDWLFCRKRRHTNDNDVAAESDKYA